MTLKANAPRMRAAHRWVVLACAALLAALLVSACGGGDDSVKSADAGSKATTDQASTTDKFVGAKPEPGTDIPQVNVKLGLRPYADNSLEWIGIKKGWYQENGINVTPIKNSDNAITQMLNGTVDLQAMYAPTLIPTLKTDSSLKQVMFTDFFSGWAILANPKLGLKSVKEYMDEGQPFEQAMASALAPLKGKTLVVAPLLDARPFAKLAFEIAKQPQPKLQVLDDPKALIAGRAGRIQFAMPTGAPTTLQFEKDGWKAIVRPSDIIEHSSGGADSPATALAGAVGLASTDKYVNANPNTVLRFVSATYRLIDEIEKDPKGTLDLYAPYLNSITGLSLSGEDIGAVFKTYDPLTNFAYGETWCRDESKLLYYKNAYTGIIKAYEGQGAIEPGKFASDDVIWACQVWEDLVKYKEMSDELLSKADGTSLDASKKELLDKAKTLYGQYNFLDSYRLAKAATE